MFVEFTCPTCHLTFVEDELHNGYDAEHPRFTHPCRAANNREVTLIRRVLG